MGSRVSTRFTRLAVSTAAAALAVSMLGAAPAGAAPAEDPGGSAPADKGGPLTPALQAVAQDSDELGVVRLPDSGPGSIMTRPSGRILVDVRLANTGEAALDQLRETGAHIRFVAPDIRTVTIAIDPADLDALAALSPLVESAQEILQPMTNAACPSGPFVSEGLQQLRADLARTQFAVQGRDVTVGVLSDTYNVLGGASQDVANGELPGTANPCGNTTPVGVQVEGPANDGIDEGRAMAQIIHDLAPKAKLLFASAFLGEAQFAQSIRDLADAGADIIVDDITYFNEPMYQDGVIAKAVADVTAQGVTYFSSAANSNEILGGNNVGSYEAPAFRSAACPASVSTHYGSPVTCHDFNPGAGTDATYGLSVGSDGGFYLLGWSEPQFGIVTDLDVCLLTTADALLGCIENDNFTTKRAFEGISFTGPRSGSLVVVRRAGTQAPRFRLISQRSDLTAVEYNTGSGGDVVGPTTFGHNASRPGVTVAAVPYNNDATLETFSSWGPATYCWGPVVGTVPATAIPCQTATVDMSATDGTQNSFFGSGSPHRFFGTSAAAPHAAAVAALILDREQCLTPNQIISAMQSTGRAVGTAPVDGAGAGLVDAQAALNSAGAANCDTTAPVVTITTPPDSGGWYHTPSVTAGVSAVDHRTVTELTCTGTAVSDLTGIGTTTATAKVTATGEGQWPITCTGKDFENNTGAAPGSANTATIRIDTTPPTLTCQAASLPQGSPGSVTAAVADALSGPASTTVSTPVSTSAPGSFTASVTGADVAGNTTTASCAYTVTALPTPPPTPKVKGPAKAKAGAKKKFTASGFPVSSDITWTVRKKGRTILTRQRTTNSEGTSKVKIRFANKGKHVVKASSGGVTATLKVKVRK